MRSLKKYSETIILFESGKRLPETIQYLFEEFSQHNKISLCREMTKIHETIERGTIASIREKINGAPRVPSQVSAAEPGIRS